MGDSVCLRCGSPKSADLVGSILRGWDLADVIRWMDGKSNCMPLTRFTHKLLNLLIISGIAFVSPYSALGVICRMLMQSERVYLRHSR
jgi:hypothetical protein